MQPARGLIKRLNARFDNNFRGNNNPVKLIEYIEALEEALGQKAVKDLLPMQPGDVPDTYADSSSLDAAVGYVPNISVSHGVRCFADWYRSYCEHNGVC